MIGLGIKSKIMKLKDFTAQYHFEYFEIKSISEYSYCKVRENDLWGIFKVNKDSAVRVSESIYSSVLYIEVFTDNIKSSGFIVSKNQMQGYIDTNGNKIIPIAYDQIVLMDDCPYLCAIIEESLYKYKKGIFRLDGTNVIPVKYEFINILWNKEKSDYYFQTNNYSKYGIYNSKGKEIIPTEAAKIELINFKNVELFKAAFGRIHDSNKDFDDLTSFKIFDKKGVVFYPYASDEEIYFEPTDKYPEPIGIGIKLHNEKDLYSLYDENGNILFNYQKIIPIEDKNTRNYPNNIYKQYIVSCKGKEGIYNAIQGCLTIPIIYESINVVNSNTFIIRKEKKYGVLGDDNKTIIPIEFDYIYFNYIDNYFFTTKDNKTGVYNIEGKIIIPIKFENITYNNDYFFIKENNKIGIYDKDGKNIIPVEFDNIDFNDNYFIVKKANKVGVYDNEGKNIIPPIEFDYINYYQNSHFFVRSNYKEGIYNINGENIIPVEFDYIHYIQNYNCFLVNKNNKNGVFNNKGEQIISTEYDEINIPHIHQIFLIQKNYKWGIYENDNKILPTIYDHIDIILYKNEPFYKVNLNNFYNIINTNGLKMFNKEYEDITFLDNGIPVQNILHHYISITKNFVIKTKNSDGTFSLYNDKGKMLIENFDNFGYECNNTNYRMFSQKRKIGLFNLNKNQIILPAIYENIIPISNQGDSQKAIVLYKQKKGIYDYNGKEVLPIIYDSIEQLNTFIFGANTSQIYYKITIDKKQGIITENNETIIPAEYERIDFCNYPTIWAIICNNHKYGVFYDKETLIPTIYDEIKLISIEGEKVFQVKDENKYGIINLKGQTIVFCKYDSIVYKNSLFHAKHNDVISIISLSGRIIFKEIKDIKPFTTSIYKLTKTNNKYILCNYKFQNISPEVDDIKLLTHNIPNTLYYITKVENYWGICKALEEEYEYILPCSYAHIEYHLVNNSIIFIIQAKDNKYGVYNNYSKEIIPAIYDKIELHTINNTYYYKVYQKEHIGIYSYDGEIIIPVSYHQVDELIENNIILYFKVTKDNLIGFYTHEGKIIIPPSVEDMEEIRSNRIMTIKIKLGNYYGLLYNNKIIIDIIYENITLLNQYSDFPLIEVTRNNKVGLFNINGEQLIPTFYDKIISKYGNCLIKLHNLWGIYTIKNNNLILPQYEEYKTYSNFLFVKKENFWGIYWDGNEIYPPLFENIEIWRDEDRDNYPAYYESKYSYILIKSKKGYGIINKWGKTIIPDLYDKIEFNKEERFIEVSDDYYYSDKYTYDITFKVKLKGLWGFYDEKGIEIYPPIFNDINNIDTKGNGIIKKGELWGYMSNFKLALPTIFNFIEHKSSALILKVNQLNDIYDASTNSYPLLRELREKDIYCQEIYLYTDKERQWRILNGIGKEECPPFPKNANITFTMQSVILLEIDNKIGVYSSNGLELVPPYYKSFKEKKEIGLTTYFIMQDFNNKYGCTTSCFQKKDIKIPFIYDYILKGSNKIQFYAKKDNKILGLNENGEILSEKDLKIYNLSLGYEYGIFEDDINRKTL